MEKQKLKFKTTKLILNDQLYEVDLEKACEFIKHHSPNSKTDLTNLSQIISYLYNNNLFSHDFLTPIDDDDDNNDDNDNDNDNNNNN